MDAEIKQSLLDKWKKLKLNKFLIDKVPRTALDERTNELLLPPATIIRNLNRYVVGKPMG